MGVLCLSIQISVERGKMQKHDRTGNNKQFHRIHFWSFVTVAKEKNQISVGQGFSPSWGGRCVNTETDIRQNNMYHYKSNGNSALIEKVQRHERLLRSSGR